MRVQQPDLQRLNQARHLPSFTTVPAVSLVRLLVGRNCPGAWDPFANWQFSGGTLALNAMPGGETLAPGATEIVPISAQGSNTVPGGCQFNGAACQP